MSKMLGLVVANCVALALPVTALGEPWLQLASHGDSLFYLDLGSVRRHGQVSAGWIKIGPTGGAAVFNKPTPLMQLLHLVVNCANDSVITDDYRSYDESGSLSGEDQTKSIGVIAPDTIEKTVEIDMCKGVGPVVDTSEFEYRKWESIHPSNITVEHWYSSRYFSKRYEIYKSYATITVWMHSDIPIDDQLSNIYWNILIDCSRSEAKTLATSAYDERGDFIRSTNPNVVFIWSKIPPGSAMDANRARYCQQAR